MSQSKRASAPPETAQQCGPFRVRRQWIEEHRDQIEYEANSEAEDAWVFQELLDWLDEVES